MVGPPRVQLSHIFRNRLCPLRGVEYDSGFRVISRDAANDHDRHPRVRNLDSEAHVSGQGRPRPQTPLDETGCVVLFPSHILPMDAGVAQCLCRDGHGAASAGGR